MSVFVILNHNLTADQREELVERFGEVLELGAENLLDDLMGDDDEV